MNPESKASPLSGWWDLLRAELRKAWSRRGVRIIGVVALGALVWLSWSNHKAASDNRSTIEQLEAALEDPDSFEKAAQDPGGPLPYFGGESEEEYRENLEGMLLFSQFRFKSAQVFLHPELSHLVTLGFFGTVPGVLLAVLVASTLIGAEFRWAYWKTAASQEPRRGRLVAGKLATVWLTLGLVMAALLALSYPLHAGFAQLLGLNLPVSGLVQPGELVTSFPDPSGGPSIWSLLKEFGAAWLTLGFYSTLAVAAVTWTRATLAGPLASIGFLVLEGSLLTRNWPVLRHALPVQQSAFLRAEIPFIEGEALRGIWYERLDELIIVFSDGGVGSQPLSGIPDWRALLVLVSWIGLVVVVSILALRARDIPG